MKSHPKRDHRKKRNRKGNKKVQKNCIMKNMNYCVFVDKNKPGSPNSWHVGIIGAEFSQVFFTCLEILGAETGVLEIPGHHISCWNPGIRVLSSWEFWGFYVFGGNPGGGDRSAGSPRSSHVLLKSLFFFLRIWKSRGRRPETDQVITCLVEIIGAEFSQVLSFFYVFGGNPGGGDRSALNPIGSFKAVYNRTEILGSEMWDENQHFSGKEMRQTGLLC